jgi:6-phosphogluconolactonase
MVLNDNRKIIAVADGTALAQAAAEHVMARMDLNKGSIAICLTGGSSPKQLYELLATDAYNRRIPWDRVHWFIGDERFVPSGDSLNNMGAARRIFLDRCAPSANVHAIPTDAATPDESASLYETKLKSIYPADRLEPARPLFDIVLMGVGSDGHTASLFPDHPAINETERWVVGVEKANVEPFVPRVTLTLPTLASCHEMVFEVGGVDKRAILTRVLAGEDLPAGRAYSVGETTWLVDRAALPENYRGR